MPRYRPALRSLARLALAAVITLATLALTALVSAQSHWTVATPLCLAGCLVVARLTDPETL